MLTSRITVPTPSQPSPEDIFSSSLNHLFTDDTQNSHGTPGASVIYTSPLHGPLTLQIPAHPSFEAGRRLFAHYLWNAAVVAADLIENGSSNDRSNDSPFKMTGKKVLELGAGTALPSVLAALSGASAVTVTDHPDSPALTTGAIAANMATNLSVNGKARTACQLSIRGYAWGSEAMYSASQYGRPVSSSADERFDRMLMCDCLWMPHQHNNLVDSAVRWLSSSVDSCAIVIAGFHTGRSIVGSFFDIAAGEDTDGRGTSGPLAIEEIYEVDVDGERREWAKERATETKEEAKRWCVVGILKMRR